MKRPLALGSSGPTPLRGRSQELGQLLEVLRRAARVGQGAVVVLSGESGIGKTALLQQAASQAQRFGFAVGYGRAEERLSIPLAPVLSSLRSGPAPLMSSGAFQGLAPLGDQPLWLVDAVGNALEQTTSTRPVMLVLDDMHWADQLSAFALRVLPGRLAGTPTVWLLATRPDLGGPADEALKAAAPELPTLALTLPPLSTEAVEQIAYDHTGAPPDARLQALLAGASGSPFLAVELLDGTLAEMSDTAPEALPAQLLLGVRRRLSTMPPQAQLLTRTGAVLGRSFTVADAAHLIGTVSINELLASLDPLVHSGVLTDDGGVLTFRHDLLWQAVYEGIPASQRRAWHRQAAQHLFDSQGRAVEAAAHAMVSAAPGDVEAVTILRRAALEVAATMPMTAAELATCAVALLTPQDPQWMEAAQEAILILARSQQTQRAVSMADQVLAQGPDADITTRVLSFLARPLWAMGMLQQLRDRIDLTLVRDDLSERARVRLYAQQALTDSHARDLDLGRKTAQDALTQARELGDAEAEETALWALGEIERNDGRNRQALRYFEQLRQLRGEPYSVDEILTFQLVDDYDASSQQIRQALDEAGADGDVGLQVVLHFAHMWHQYSLGRIDEAETSALVAIKAGEELQEYAFMTEARLVLCRVAQLRGDTRSARIHLELAEDIPRSDDGTSAMMLLFMRAWLAESEGDLDSARILAQQVVSETITFRHRCRWEASWMVEAARIARRSADQDLMRDVACLADTLAQRNPDVPTCRGTAAHIKGLAAGDWQLLESAVTALRDSPRILLLADAVCDYGQAMLAAGIREKAVEAFDEAGILFRQAGAVGEVRRMQAQLRQLGVRRRWASAADRPSRGWDALTQSEKRVAQLIAQGYTNRAAAAELLLSPNTVATHLRAVFGKLGVKSRVQLANVMRESGWL
ncbi:AAA family ATPase [Streptomyces sp. NPDC093228]|uniref:helix-turn-helix transcriptional regulator n=1 Tax=Streptomyces sp. NPDC093228 TaxID=3155070 RepID=UPI003440EFB4